MLLDFQTSLKNALLSGDFEGVEKHGIPSIQVKNRLPIYRNNFYASLIEVLAAAYPKIAALVGSDNFTYLARQFVEKHPPREAQLYQYGADFAEFLNLLPHVLSDFPFICDLAKLEWARQEAYFAKNEEPLKPDYLVSLVPEEIFDLTLKLKTGCQALHLQHSVSQYVMEGSVAQDSFPIIEEEFVLVYRDETREEIPVCMLSRAEYFYLEHIESGKSVGESFVQISERFSNFDLQETLVKFFSILIFRE